MAIIGITNDTHFRDSNPKNRKDDYFQSILDKVEFILKNVDILFILGDIFDAPIVSTLCVNRVNMLFKRYEREGKKIYLLLGNHDKLGQNKSLLPTSFGSLIIDNPKRNFKEPIFIDNYNFIPIMDYTNIPEIQDNGNINILCGHALFEIPDDYTIKKSEIPNNFNYVLLGHDHLEYPTEIINDNTTLIRLGALARKERNESNLVRTPQYLEIDTTKEKDKQLQVVDIPCQKGLEIFLEDFLDEEKEPLQIDLSGLKKLLTSSNKMSLYTILQRIKTPEHIIDLIQEIRALK